jgi:tetratricopeptide (TPR) repeat protein
MSRSRSRIAVATAIFLAGAALGAFASSKVRVDTSFWSGKTPAQAAESLVGAARTLAGDGSYENIAVARVLYLSGSKAEGQAILDHVMAGKVKDGDVIRVARVYRDAGEWEKAKPLFDRVVDMAPKDEDWLAEIGADYLLAGDRARAEELFSRSFAQDPSNLSNTLTAAGAYLGIAPQR